MLGPWSIWHVHSYEGYQKNAVNMGHFIFQFKDVGIPKLFSMFNQPVVITEIE
jgi:hypothetical protein